MDLDGDEPDDEDEIEKEKISAKWMDIVSKLRSGGCSHECLDDAYQSFAWIVDRMSEFLTRKVAEYEAASGVSLAAFIKSVDMDTLFYVNKNISSKYLRGKFVDQAEGRVKGEVLRVPLSQRRDGRPRALGNGEFGFVYYRSVRKWLKELGKSRAVRNEWKNNTERLKQHFMWANVQSTTVVHSHPLKGTLAAEASVDTTDPVVFIEVYSDEVQHTSGQIRNKQDSKLLHVYIATRNIAGPPSRRNAYFATNILLRPGDYNWNEEDRKLGRLYRELNSLIDNGITFDDGETFAVRLFTFSGDMLEINNNVGMTTVFGSADFVDRFSYITKSARLSATKIEDIEEARRNLRTREEVEKDLEALASGDIDGARGMVRRAGLMDIKKYDCFKIGSTSSCLGHDIMAGYAKVRASFPEVPLCLQI